MIGYQKEDGVVQYPTFSIYYKDLVILTLSCTQDRERYEVVGPPSFSRMLPCCFHEVQKSKPRCQWRYVDCTHCSKLLEVGIIPPKLCEVF